MPSSPAWTVRLDEIISNLAALPFVDAGIVARELNIKPRRAQQILSPCISQHVGRNGIAEPEAVIERLRQIVKQEGPAIETHRRQKLAKAINPTEKPLWVEAPTKIVDQTFDVEGVSVQPCEIRICFGTTLEAKQKLLALAMAIRNQPEVFEQIAGGPEK